MPRSKSAIPKYRKHRSSGQAIVTLSGKDLYLGRHGSKASRAEYDRLVAEWISSGRSLPPTDRAKAELTMNGLMLGYLRYAKRYYRKHGRPTSEVCAIKIVLRDVQHLYARTKAADFGPKSLKAVRQLWIDRGLARTTINQNTSRATRMFRWAVAEELLLPNVHQALMAVPGLRKGRTDVRETGPVKPVGHESLRTTLEQLGGTVRDMVRVQLLAVMRPGEVVSMRPSDIDRSGDVWKYRPHGHKTEHHDRSRIVQIGPEAQKILIPYLLRPSAQPCFSPQESEEQRRREQRLNRKSKVQPSQRDRGKPHAKRKPKGQYTVDSYRRAIHRACDAAKVPRCWPSTKRRSPTSSKRSRTWPPTTRCSSVPCSVADGNDLRISVGRR